MKINPFLPILGGLSILAASCSKELRYTKEELFALAREGDPGMSLVLPGSMSEGINCSDYTPSCQSAHIVKVKNLDMFALEYMTEEEARSAARKIKGYCLRNWVFDDVTGEPVLERFVVEVLKAKKP